MLVGKSHLKSNKGLFIIGQSDPQFWYPHFGSTIGYL